MKHVAKYYYMLVNAMISCTCDILRFTSITDTDDVRSLLTSGYRQCVLVHFLVLQLSSLPFHSATSSLTKPLKELLFIDTTSFTQWPHARKMHWKWTWGLWPLIFYKWLNSLLPCSRVDGRCPSTSHHGIVPFSHRINKRIKLELSFSLA